MQAASRSGASSSRGWGIDVARGMADVEEPGGFGQAAHIPHILVKDEGFHVGVGDGAAAVLPGRGHHFIRGQVEVIGLLRPGLGDFPILAELAVQVAARGGDGKREAPGQEVKEGFLFNGVQVDGAGVAVHQAVIFALPGSPGRRIPPGLRAKPRSSGDRAGIAPGPGPAGGRRRRDGASRNRTAPPGRGPAGRGGTAAPGPRRRPGQKSGGCTLSRINLAIRTS